MYRHFRLAFLDYDRTLFTHSYPVPGEKHLTYQEECFEEFVNQARRHSGDKPVKCMQDAVRIMQESGCICYVLTHEIFSLRDDMKKDMAKKYYNIDKYLSVDSADHKIDMMLAVAAAHNVNPRDCLFVDDRMDIVYKACAAGFVGIPVINVAQLFEDGIAGS